MNQRIYYYGMIALLVLLSFMVVLAIQKLACYLMKKYILANKIIIYYLEV